MAQQLGHKAAELGLDVDDLKAVREYTEQLKRRRTELFNARENQNLQNLAPPFDSSDGLMQSQTGLVIQGGLKMTELKQEALEYRAKFEEMMEENDKLR